MSRDNNNLKKAGGSRRGNNEGSIYKRADGTWCGQVLIGYQANGKPRRKTFYGKTRSEVAQKLIRVAGDSLLGTETDERSSITVTEFAKTWLNHHKRYEVTPRTLDWYQTQVGCHIVPALGQYALNKLTTGDIQRLYVDMMASNLSHRTLKAVSVTLNQLLSWAKEKGHITNNPGTEAKIPRYDRSVQERPNEAFPIDVRQALLEAAKSTPMMDAALNLLMFSGVRIGEMLALQWWHIDFTAGIVQIRQAATLEPVSDESGKRKSYETTVSTTKTVAGLRKIRLPAHVLDCLTEWRECCSKRNEALALDESYVFATRKGKLQTYSGFRAAYRRFLAKHGFEEKGMNLHRYRHTYATVLLESGVNPRIVQKLMGHQDIETTLGTYSHVVEEVYEGVAGILDKVHADMEDGSYKPEIAPDTAIA